MLGDIDLTGFVFTREEWLDLDDDDRTELIEAAAHYGSPAQDDGLMASPPA